MFGAAGWTYSRPAASKAVKLDPGADSQRSLEATRRQEDVRVGSFKGNGALALGSRCVVKKRCVGLWSSGTSAASE